MAMCTHFAIKLTDIFRDREEVEERKKERKNPAIAFAHFHQPRTDFMVNVSKFVGENCEVILGMMVKTTPIYDLHGIRIPVSEQIRCETEEIQTRGNRICKTYCA